MEWYLIAGALLVSIALAASFVDRLPLTLAVVYLGVGMALGPWGAGLLEINPIVESGALERLAEAAVVVSLFGAGLRLRLAPNDRTWIVPLRLAFVSMTVTIGLIALLGWWLLDLSPGFAILLGAVLAPTDPVLAGEVQVNDAWDRDRLRLGLTAEAGLNDGTAFPFVILGLGLMGLDELGPGGAQWFAVDLIGATLGGLAIGALIATVIGKAVLHLRRRHGHAVGLDGFLMLGILAVAYAGAHYAHTAGFLAAFAAGVALRRIEHREGGDDPADEAKAPRGDEAATHPEQAPAYLAQALLERNEALERIAELGLVVVIGSMLYRIELAWDVVWIVPALLLIIRPVSVFVGLVKARITPQQRRLTAWFGLRGIGSLYYLAFALEHGVSGDEATLLMGLTLLTIAVSIVVHGVSVTPLLSRYRGEPRQAAIERPAGSVP
jgi:sodium/hydrogen antiporter